ncbi:MAG: hypothetical protein ABJE10_03395 [bacterium]
MTVACFVVAGLLMPAHAAYAQQREIPVQAGVTLERDTVTVGDVVRLTVRVHAPPGATINFPAAVDSLGPVQSLEPPTVRDGADTASGSDRIAIYRLAAWDIGKQPIKLGDVLVQSEDGERRVALDLPILFVQSVLPADTALRVPKPARPLLTMPAPIPWWWWLVGALIAIALGLGAWWWARRKRRNGAATGDPFADAKSSFERVEKLRLIEAGEPGRHAALMTDVLRRYLADRFDTVSLAQTSSELLAAVRGTSTVSHEKLRTLLSAIDPVKFAAAPLGADRARSIGEDAKLIVREEHDRAAALAVAQAGEKERAA